MRYYSNFLMLFSLTKMFPEPCVVSPLSGNLVLRGDISLRYLILLRSDLMENLVVFKVWKFYSPREFFLLLKLLPPEFFEKFELTDALLTVRNAFVDKL